MQVKARVSGAAELSGNPGSRSRGSAESQSSGRIPGLLSCLTIQNWVQVKERVSGAAELSGNPEMGAS